MQCPRCAAQNPVGASFCDECGARLDEATCASCGAANRAAARFCSRCGARLGGPAPGAYTPGHLAEKILTSRGALEGERKQVTVLFADIKGSMELLADRDPEEARALLDPVLTRMMEAVHYYEGTVNQVLGDGIMALFGAPLAHEDHAVRACYAALRMQQSVARYAAETRRLADVPLLIRVGLNSGEVVVRAIGNDLHMDYTAVGQTTHLAARMEQTARPGAVVATATTFQLARGWVEARPLGALPVKGVVEPVEAYEIVGTTRARSRLQAASPESLTPFVGRREEIGRLASALARAAAGRGGAVVVTGDPGLGKSRLFWELVHSPAVEGWTVLESVAVAHGKTTPYLPIADLVRGLLGVDARDDAGTVREKVEAGVAALGGGAAIDPVPLVALLDALPGGDAFAALDPADRRRRTLDAARAAFLAASAVRPLLIVVENLEWVDSQSRALLDELLEAAPSARLLLLASHRPAHEPGWPEAPHVQRMRLEPLPPDVAESLLAALLGDGPELAPLRRLLIDRIGGNPFFLEESVRSLAETGVIAGERGARRLARALSVQIPATVQAIVSARIDRLSPDDKRLLQAAAVIGRDVPERLLEPIAELPAGELRRALRRLEEAGFLHARGLAPDVEHVFTHALTHDVAYASLLLDRRRALHARVADVMAAAGSGPPDRLAYHAFLGEQWERAARAYRAAATSAASRAANAEAVACLERALEAVERLPETPATLAQAIDVRLELRPPLLQLGRLGDVLTRSLEAERLAQRAGDDRRLASVYTYLINYHYLKGEPDLAMEYGERCLALARAGGDAELSALATRYMGHLFHTLGQYRRAQAVLTENVEQLEAAAAGGGLSVSYAASAAWLSFTLAELGEFGEADAYATRSERAASADGHAYSRAIAWTLRGLARVRQGRFEEAAEPLERALAACRERQLAIWQPIPSSLLGLVLATKGEPATGLALLSDAVTQSEALGVRAYLALWTANLAEGFLLAGQAERARAAGDRALELAIAHRERGHQAWALRVLGDIALLAGPPDVARAERCYGQALELAGELEMRPLVAHCHLALGRLHARERNRPRAEEHLALATELFCEMGMHRWLAESRAALRQLGALFIVSRDHTALAAVLARAFVDDDRVRIILDRRRGIDRRQQTATLARDRRRSDRRRHQDIDARLRDRALVVVG